MTGIRSKADKVILGVYDLVAEQPPPRKAYVPSLFLHFRRKMLPANPCSLTSSPAPHAAARAPVPARPAARRRSTVIAAAGCMAAGAAAHRAAIAMPGGMAPAPKASAPSPAICGRVPGSSPSPTPCCGWTRRAGKPPRAHGWRSVARRGGSRKTKNGRSTPCTRKNGVLRMPFI